MKNVIVSLVVGVLFAAGFVAAFHMYASVKRENLRAQISQDMQIMMHGTLDNGKTARTDLEAHIKELDSWE